MKNTARLLVLLAGLVCTYFAVATPVRDGGGFPSCNPKTGCPK
jgi:hypothetical protein